MNDTPLQILVVEDDALVARQVHEALQQAGYEVVTAGSGWEAQKVLRTQRPRIIVSSLRLPDMEGLSLRDQVLSDPSLLDTPFLFLTESGDIEQEIEALRSRADDFIEKPIKPIILVERVKAVLARRAAYEDMVRVDPLTRLLKRPSLESEIETQIRRANATERIDTAVYIDPDDITKLNREHGWTMGDLMLTCLAGIICTNVRTEDVAGRLEEDKFVLYLPNTPVEGAQILMDRINNLMRTVSSATSGVAVGLTNGVVETPSEASSLAEIVARGSEAVETGKRTGKGHTNLWRDTQQKPVL